MYNRSIIVGRFTSDPELKITPSGVEVCSFTLAVDRPFKSQSGEKQTDFINCVAWRNTAEFLSRYFQKGSAALVEGSIQVRQYTDKNGNKRTAWEIVADNVRFVESKGSNESRPAPKHADSGTISAPNDQDFTEIEDNGDLPF